MSDSALLISTLASSATVGGRSSARVPCLTIACHPDPRRIGERALLTPLLVRETVRLSRSETRFSQPGGEQLRPLEDPYLSRDPIQITATHEPRGLSLDHLPERALIDGQLARTVCKLPETALQRGVLLQLSNRILLLLHESAAEQPLAIEGILGQSDAIDYLRRQLWRIAALDTPVLIRGESGAGKERVAQALHALSRRRASPLVAVNMATLSESTAAGALFGHARGAFTGAVARHRGFFERAHGGTLFLDEIGDTPASVQPMLLRVLETGRVQPLGDEQERSVDLRVLAATELDLERETSTGSFRAALRHRLAGYELVVPALRERPEDIAVLFVHFLRSELQKLGRESLLDGTAAAPNPPLAARLVSRLLHHAFPGNVRELQHLARRLAIDALDAGTFELNAEAEKVFCTDPANPGSGRVVEPAESAAATTASAPVRLDPAELLEALERHAFSPMRVAAELGVPPSTVHFWMQRLKIRRATDLDHAELQRADADCAGDLDAMAKQLRVSPRALKLALRRLQPPNGRNG